MPAISINKLGVNDDPLYPEANVEGKILRDRPLIMTVIEEGMESGDPSVMIYSPDPEQPILIQTSLKSLIVATQGLQIMAQHHFDWEMPV